MMVMWGIDAHKRSHTVVAVDPAGAEIGSVTVAATTAGHLRAMQWAAKYTQQQWAIEDCRALSRRLEGDLLGVGERVVRVPPKMMARSRATARQAGKSIQSMRWRLGEQHCVNLTYQWHSLMDCRARFGCWSTTAKPLCTNAPGSRTSCSGGSTNSNLATTHLRGHSTGTAPLMPSTNSLTGAIVPASPPSAVFSVRELCRSWRRESVSRHRATAHRRSMTRSGSPFYPDRATRPAVGCWGSRGPAN